MYILLTILLITLWCNSFKIMLQSGMVLHWLYLLFISTYTTKIDGHVVLKHIIPIFIRKPLFECAYCMPSIHGAIVYLLVTSIYNVESSFSGYFLVVIPSIITSGVLREWLLNQDWINKIEIENY